MKLSNQKINDLARIIADRIETEPSLEVFRDQNDIRLRIKHVITSELKIGEEIDKIARKMIQGQAKAPPEGSRDWEVLYGKYYEEELNRRNIRKDSSRRHR